MPIVGDDIKSQVGATITHRVLTKLFEDRGVEVQRTYQLNVGGNMDFKNMLERDRLESKKISKTQSVTSQIPDRDLGERNVHIGPSDYVAWLDDRKWAFVRLEGKTFGDVPLNLEYKLEVWDSPNSAGIIIDALRAAKIAKDRGIGGPILSASCYFMKSPPVQYFDDEARAGRAGLHRRHRRALTLALATGSQLIRQCRPVTRAGSALSAVTRAVSSASGPPGRSRRGSAAAAGGAAPATTSCRARR